MTNACACCSSSGCRGSRCSSRQTHEEQVSTSELFLRLNSNFRQIWYFLLTWSTDDFPWAGCTVVGQVSKLHLRGSPALFAKARPIVMIFQMPQTYLDKKTNTEVGTKSFTSTWSTSHSPKPSSPLTALKWEITSLISFGPPP